MSINASSGIIDDPHRRRPIIKYSQGVLHKSIQFISNRFVIVLLLGSLALLFVSQYKQYEERKKVSRHIAALKTEAAGIVDKNQQLEDSLKYLSTTAAGDRLARQMNLKKEGEIAVVFMPPKDGEVLAGGTAQPSHVRAWWDYFFAKPTH